MAARMHFWPPSLRPEFWPFLPSIYCIVLMAGLTFLLQQPRHVFLFFFRMPNKVNGFVYCREGISKLPDYFLPHAVNISSQNAYEFMDMSYFISRHVSMIMLLMECLTVLSCVFLKMLFLYILAFRLLR